MHGSRPTFPDPEHGARHVATCLKRVRSFPTTTKGPDLGGLSGLSCISTLDRT